ncbi:hypothetical protein EGC76_01450 [Pseudidiomarina gelatinasegens]|uniref:Uncharacterized protein n=1 Tax=Pseudidiomarina gelatinasegens TaxID=2487740 RepID=A0A443Z7J2_9GAMM|nr:hypothetical protein [Pseudidiomarina gelatinasegens]RWU12908.1 hypothetical protein EGC76_01450 [Pseudidiomarina gelatinasegens]
MARDIPGFFDILLPSLTRSVVAGFNRRAFQVPASEKINLDDLARSKLQPSMLFELAYSRADQLLNNHDNWQDVIQSALSKQKRYFDYRETPSPSDEDLDFSGAVAKRIIGGLEFIRHTYRSDSLVIAPKIPGMHWIASSYGDFALDDHLIEIKCSARNFSRADYKQLVIYWLLLLADSRVHSSKPPNFGVLFNPRLNLITTFGFEELIDIAGAGMNCVELLGLFESLIGDYGERARL